MDELIKAIVAKYTSASGATLRALTGDLLWVDSAPQSASGAWCVVSAASNDIEHVMGSSGTYTQDVTVTFRICSDSSLTTCMVALPLLTALYDDVSLSMTGYTAILFQRTRVTPARDFDSEGYLVYVDYHVIIGH